MLEVLEIPAASLETIKVPVSAREDGVEVVPTGYQVAFSVFEQGTAVGTFQPGTWETDGDVHLARAVVGTGSNLPLVVNKRFEVYIKITTTGSAEIIQRPVCLIDAI